MHSDIHCNYQSATILQLLARKNEPLLIRGDPLFVLDLYFQVVDGITRFYLRTCSDNQSSGFDVISRPTAIPTPVLDRSKNALGMRTRS